MSRQNRSAEVKAHTGLGQGLLHMLPGDGRQQTPQRLGARIDHIHLVTGMHQVIGELAANQASANHRGTPSAFQLLAKRRVILQVIDREHPVRRIALQG